MRKLILAVCCIGLLSSACSSTEPSTRQLQEVKIVGHVPYKEEGSGIAWKVTHEHWIYENTSSKERFLSTDKYGEVGEIVKMRR